MSRKLTAPEYHEEKLQCPYDPVHWIAPDVMLKHLYKCKKALLKQPTSPYYSKALDYQECRWSALHRVASKDLTRHEENCPDKRKRDVMQLREDIATSEAKPAWANCVGEIAPPAATGGGDEDWGDEVGTGGYDPNARIEADPNLIYNPQGLTPAERRNYKLDRNYRAAEALQNKQPEVRSKHSGHYKENSPKAQSKNSKAKKGGDDEWTTVGGNVGRGRAKQRTNDSFDNFAQGISGALPNVAPIGRGRGRGRGSGAM